MNKNDKEELSYLEGLESQQMLTNASDRDRLEELRHPRRNSAAKKSTAKKAAAKKAAAKKSAPKKTTNTSNAQEYPNPDNSASAKKSGAPGGKAN